MRGDVPSASGADAARAGEVSMMALRRDYDEGHRLGFATLNCERCGMTLEARMNAGKRVPCLSPAMRAVWEAQRAPGRVNLWAMGNVYRACRRLYIGDMRSLEGELPSWRGLWRAIRTDGAAKGYDRGLNEGLRLARMQEARKFDRYLDEILEQTMARNRARDVCPLCDNAGTCGEQPGQCPLRYETVSIEVQAG